MGGTARNQWSLLLAAMALGLAWNFVLAPSSVHAGCRHPAPSVAHFEQLTEAGAITPRESETSKPCRGLLCSKAPTAPASTSLGPVTFEPWAMIVVDRIFVIEASDGVPSYVALEVREPLALSIFHPPRS